MLDPDASEAVAQIKHWLVVNIPGSNVKDGKVLAEYVGSGPPEGSGIQCKLV